MKKLMSMTSVRVTVSNYTVKMKEKLRSLNFRPYRCWNIILVAFTTSPSLLWWSWGNDWEWVGSKWLKWVLMEEFKRTQSDLITLNPAQPPISAETTSLPFSVSITLLCLQDPNSFDCSFYSETRNSISSCPNSTANYLSLSPSLPPPLSLCLFTVSTSIIRVPASLKDQLQS